MPVLLVLGSHVRRRSRVTVLNASAVPRSAGKSNSIASSEVVTSNGVSKVANMPKKDSSASGHLQAPCVPWRADRGRQRPAWRWHRRRAWGRSKAPQEQGRRQHRDRFRGGGIAATNGTLKIKRSVIARNSAGGALVAASVEPRQLAVRGDLDLKKQDRRQRGNRRGRRGLHIQPRTPGRMGPPWEQGQTIRPPSRIFFSPNVGFLLADLGISVSGPRFPPAPVLASHNLLAESPPHIRGIGGPKSHSGRIAANGPRSASFRREPVS
jgi:hypothetical protein